MSISTKTIQKIVDLGLPAETEKKVMLLLCEAVEACEQLYSPRYGRTKANPSAPDPRRQECSGPMWARLRAQVFQRDGFECVYCGADQDLAADHVLPFSRGGRSTLENLATACKSCNSSKKDRTPEEWLCQ